MPSTSSQGKDKDMREIKFRAWDKKQNKIAYSSNDFPEGYDYSTSISLSFEGQIELWTGDDGGKNGLWEHSERYEKDRFSLMQFTGLKDKNGKEIYEGDIVLCSDDNGCFPEEYHEEKDEYIPTGKYEVVYQAEQGYAAFELKDSPCEDMNGLAYACENSIEVIGNIYENSNLLSGKDI
jgi:uncharacterized phage protein (TIGR01671 family)